MTRAVVLSAGMLLLVSCGGPFPDGGTLPELDRGARNPRVEPDRTIFEVEPSPIGTEVWIRKKTGPTTADGGAVASDAGAHLVDAGSAGVDAGSPASDAGSEVADAGSPVLDAGSAVADAGSPILDAGSRVDAGSPPPAPLSCLKIMPLGDSITLGVNGGYRNNLYTSLSTSGCGVNFVGSQYDPYAVCVDKDHEGHSGFTIGQVASNVSAWLSSAAPDYVLLMIGTNDIAWWSAQSGAQIADTHAQLVDQILAQRPNSWVIVASIPPITSQLIAPNNVDRAQLGRDFNAAIKIRMTARQAAGMRVRFADVYSVLTVSDLYDGVHPTQQAHAKVAAAFFQALRPVTTCTSPKTCGN